MDKFWVGTILIPPDRRLFYLHGRHLGRCGGRGEFHPQGLGLARRDVGPELIGVGPGSGRDVRAVVVGSAKDMFIVYCLASLAPPLKA